MLAIVTFQPEFQPPWLDLAQVTPLRLTRLGKRYAMEMVQKAAPDLPDQLHQKIVAATDGIPLFVEEVTSTIRESDMRERQARPAGTHAHADSIAIPLTLHDSLNARLDQLGPLKETLDPRSFTIATFALCGFANFSSIGIQIGGIGALAPNKREELARLGIRAMLAGTMANLMSASIVGMLM